MDIWYQIRYTDKDGVKTLQRNKYPTKERVFKELENTKKIADRYQVTLDVVKVTKTVEIIKDI